MFWRCRPILWVSRIWPHWVQNLAGCVKCQVQTIYYISTKMDKDRKIRAIPLLKSSGLSLAEIDAAIQWKFVHKKKIALVWTNALSMRSQLDVMSAFAWKSDLNIVYYFAWGTLSPDQSAEQPSTRAAGGAVWRRGCGADGTWQHCHYYCFSRQRQSTESRRPKKGDRLQWVFSVGVSLLDSLPM